MSRGGEVRFYWGDAEQTFRLRIGELRQLQERCNAGPPVISDRLRNDRWYVDDITETLRLGLIGAGMPLDEAGALIRRFVDPVPLAQNRLYAYAVLMAALVGAPDEVLPKKGEEDETKAPSSQMENGPSPTSTAAAHESTALPLQ